jgi:hypothetical protein
MLQALHTTPWPEMRNHWGLSSEQIARVTGWAIRTLLADLERRGAEAFRGCGWIEKPCDGSA